MRQKDCYNFKASLDHAVSFSMAGATSLNPCLKNQMEETIIREQADQNMTDEGEAEAC